MIPTCRPFTYIYHHEVDENASKKNLNDSPLKKKNGFSKTSVICHIFVVTH